MSIMTVTGPIDSHNLGHIQLHEHLLCDLSRYVKAGKPTQDWPVGISNYYSARVDRNNVVDMVLDERTHAIDALQDYGNAGGSVLVDATSCGLGRDPDGLRAVSLAADVPVVMGAGYYAAPFHPPEVAELSEDEIFRGIVDDLTVGVGYHQIRAGIIGEIGMSWPPEQSEMKVLRAAARAQRSTGAAMLIHPGRARSAPAHHMQVVREAGGIASRTIMCHIDRTLFTVEEMATLATTGCILEFDLFGTESSYYPPAPEVDLPNDGMRVQYIRHLIDSGFQNQIVISEDVCRKTQLKPYGGEGYDHILKRVIPLMLRRGITKEQVRRITQETPNQLLNIA